MVVSLYDMIINKRCLREFTYCLHTTYMIDIDLLRFARNQLYTGLAISVVHAGFLCFLDFHNKNIYTTEKTLPQRWKPLHHRGNVVSTVETFLAFSLIVNQDHGVYCDLVKSKSREVC